MRKFPGYSILAVGGLKSLAYPIASFQPERFQQPSFYPTVNLEVCETERRVKAGLSGENLVSIPCIAVLNANLRPVSLNRLMSRIRERVPSCKIIIDGFDQVDYPKIDDKNFIAFNETRDLPIQKALEAIFHLKMSSPRQQAIDRYYAQVLLCNFADISLVGGADFSSLTVLTQMMMGTVKGERFLDHLIEIENMEMPSKFTRQDAQAMFAELTEKK